MSEVNEPFDGRDYPIGFYVFVINITLKDGSKIFEEEVVYLIK